MFVGVDPYRKLIEHRVARRHALQVRFEEQPELPFKGDDVTRVGERQAQIVRPHQVARELVNRAEYDEEQGDDRELSQPFVAEGFRCWSGVGGDNRLADRNEAGTQAGGKNHSSSNGRHPNHGKRSACSKHRHVCDSGFCADACQRLDPPQTPSSSHACTRESGWRGPSAWRIDQFGDGARR